MLSNLSRKGFRNGISVSDKVIYGIGMVSYQWSCIENFIDIWILNTRGQPAEAILGNQSTFMQRAKLLRDTVHQQATEPWRTRLIRIIDQITGTKGERDRIIHHLWALDGERPSVTNIRPSSKEDVWKIDYPKLRAVALKLDAHRHSLIAVQLEACASSDGPKTIENAWRHITRSDD